MKVFSQRFSRDTTRVTAKEAVNAALIPYTDYSGELETMSYKIDHLTKVLSMVILMLPEERYIAILNDLGWQAEDV